MTEKRLRRKSYSNSESFIITNPAFNFFCIDQIFIFIQAIYCKQKKKNNNNNKKKTSVPL